MIFARKIFPRLFFWGGGDYTLADVAASGVVWLILTKRRYSCPASKEVVSDAIYRNCERARARCGTAL